ncbi:helical backbone metal receptor [Burkholderiales bacterium]|nr:helical backbone metal receptor [Burkholderiales bacterium]
MLDALNIDHEPISGSARIVSVVPSITELLFDLDLADNVVGRTGFCFYPRPEVRRVPKIGGTKDFDLEKLRSLHATHLIVNVDENPRDLVDAARRFIPNILVTHPLSPVDNISLYQLMGYVFNRVDKAETLAERFMNSYLSATSQTDKLAPERVLYIIWKKPWMTISQDTYIARVLASVGLDQIEVDSEARYPEVNIKALAGDVDHILLSTEPFAFRKKDIQELTLEIEGCGKPKISLINGEMTSWYGSRAIQGFDYLKSYRSSLISG